MGLIENLNRDAFLSIGRKLQWVRFDYSTHAAIPRVVSDGKTLVDTSDAPGTGAPPAGMLIIACREQPGTRTARITVSTLDLAATYNVTLNGTAVAYNALSGGAADEEDVIQGIRDAINGNATLTAAGITAAADDSDGDGSDDVVIVTRNVTTDYPVDAFSATGTGVLAVTADAVDCDASVYLAPGGSAAGSGEVAPASWAAALLPDGSLAAGLSITTDNYTTPLRLAGYQRAYVRLYGLSKSATGGGDAAGLVATAYAYIGTAVLEE